MKRERKLWRQFLAKGKVADCPVYDMHGHLGYFYGAHLPLGDSPVLDRILSRAGVKMVAFCHQYSLFSPDIGNGVNIEWVRKFPKCLRAYCGINPNYPDNIREDLRTYDRLRDVYIGFKFLAGYHNMPITHDAYAPAWEKANGEGLLVLLHTWGNNPYDGHEQVRKVAAKYPGAKILMGHSCHGAWNEAVHLVMDFPNTYLELCAVVDERGVLEKFVAESGSERILFGTDFPWFNHHYYIGAVLGSGISDGDCHNILHRNAERLLEKMGGD